MAKEIAMTKDDIRWQTESDVEALVRADVVKKDPKRLKAAIIMAADKAQEEVENAKSYKKISKMNYQGIQKKNIKTKVSQMSDKQLRS